MRTFAAVIPGRVTMLKATSRVSSAKICSGDPPARLSSVGSTVPSMEFSIGTQAKSAAPVRTASSAAGVLSVGSGPTSAPPGTMTPATILSSAASLKVPSGPR